MPLNAFPYIGGKARLADDIIAVFDEHDCYVEPFGGSAAVLLNKPRTRVEVYNEINRNVSTFFEVVRDKPDELQTYLSATPYSEELNKKYTAELYEYDTDLTDVERAAKFFFVSYSTFGGKVSGSFKRPSPRYSGGDTDNWRVAANTFDNALDKIDTLAKRFKRVNVECRDWKEAVEAYDSPGTLFYFDPPYDTGHGKGSEYKHTFDKDDLESVLPDLRGKWVLSQGRVPEWARDYYIQSVGFDHRINNTTGPTDAQEYLITNYDPAGTDELTDANQTCVGEFL